MISALKKSVVFVYKRLLIYPSESLAFYLQDRLYDQKEYVRLRAYKGKVLNLPTHYSHT